MSEQQGDIASGYSISIYALSEKALTVVFGNTISERLWRQVSSFNQLLKQNPFPGLITTVPAYSTLTVFFDLIQVAQSDLPGKTCYEKVSGYLKQLSHSAPGLAVQAGKHVVIPVCYGGDFGPDILTVAQNNDLTEKEVIALHSSAVYSVYMMGFVPGFAYMGGMSQSLSTPRKEVPQAAIPAGSVGIAGLQTGIYPIAIPGGWQIIGRTPLQMFNAARQNPALLQGGDTVTFKAITIDEFNAYPV
ncbi:5-oxoprolinase subunit PxpB [Pedobacter kyungheensis]|uniref:5-oxoprolinase subunit PxpB n=1 Tax=Pedobacter kyungheensis TaxID=1069985 RepID=UPI00068D7F8F|nr:5-oxoprolinase subunit PxpB [Pedobacter kyungheensis]